MKKLLFILALVGFAAGAQAQTETDYPTLKKSVNSNTFWSNWFVGLGFDLQASYTDQERHLHLSKNPFQNDRLGYGGEITLGKWFAPSIGARLRGHVGQGAYMPKVDGNDKYMAFDVQFQTLFNINNIICGYNPNRVWTISPYIGVGFAHHMSHGGDYSPIFSCGLYNQFNVSKKWYISLDIYAETMAAQFDGAWIEGYNTNLSDTRDNAFGVSVGVGYNIGKTGWQKTPDVAAIMALHEEAVNGLKARIDEQERENEALKEQLRNRKPIVTERVVREIVPGAPASVFFNLNSARIASKKDLVNVQAIVDAAKQNGKKIVVKGYADSKTGSAAYNKTLSEKRAAAVVAAIEAMGVDSSNIISSGEGGVNELAPYSYNRRVVVSLE